MQVRPVALELMQFALPPEIFAAIDLETLELSEDSFIDEQLRAHFTDICYTGKMKDGTNFRTTILFEHKSDLPESPITAQLFRYISNIWDSDIRQQRALTLTIPILIYHGTQPIVKETPAMLFPGASADQLSYVPAFNYEIVDITRLSDEAIHTMHFLLLRNIFLALKYGRNEKYVATYWEKIIIFAPEKRNDSIHFNLFQATVLYLNRISPQFNNNIKNMNAALSSAEQEVIKPYLVELYEQGIEKGIEQGIEKTVLLFLKKNADWTDEQIARTFDVKKEWVQQLRKKVKK